MRGKERESGREVERERQGNKEGKKDTEGEDGVRDNKEKRAYDSVKHLADVSGRQSEGRRYNMIRYDLIENDIMRSYNKLNGGGRDKDRCREID